MSNKKLIYCTMLNKRTWLMICFHWTPGFSLVLGTYSGKGTETHISQAGRLSTWGQPAHSLAGAPSSSYHRGAKSVPTLRRLPTVAWVRGCGHESIYDFEHIRFSWSTCRITCVSIERFCRTIELNDKHLVYGIWKLKLIERKSRTKESSIKLIRVVLHQRALSFGFWRCVMRFSK